MCTNGSSGAYYMKNRMLIAFFLIHGKRSACFKAVQ